MPGPAVNVPLPGAVYSIASKPYSLWPAGGRIAPRRFVNASTVDDGTGGGSGGGNGHGTGARPERGAGGADGSEGWRHGARLHAEGNRRKNAQAVGLPRQAGGRDRLVPARLHAGLHDRVQVAGG